MDCPALTPQHLATSVDIFDCHRKADGAVGGLVGRSQGCWRIRYLCRTRSLEQRIVWPRMSVALLLRSRFLTNPGAETGLPSGPGRWLVAAPGRSECLLTARPRLSLASSPRPHTQSAYVDSDPASPLLVWARQHERRRGGGAGCAQCEI